MILNILLSILENISALMQYRFPLFFYCEKNVLRVTDEKKQWRRMLVYCNNDNDGNSLLSDWV